MRTQNQQQRPHCRYGPTCKFLPTNNCNFYHPPQDSALRNRNNVHRPQQHQPHQQQQQHQQPQQQHQHERRSASKGKRQSYNQPYGPYSHDQQQPNRQNTPFSAKGKEDPVKLLCKGFHAGSCKFGEKCERLHQYHYTNPHAIRRLEFRREIPQEVESRLSKIECEGKEIFALRQGSEVVLFEYSFEEGQLTSLGGSVCLPGKCEYYQQRQKTFYFSAENDTTKYSDMGFNNLEAEETAWIPNSHNSKITGIVHWDKSTLFSASIAGDIKVWSKTEGGYVVNKEASEMLLRSYNPNGKPIEILFLDIFTINEVQIFSAGTNDGRLLFWSGGSFEFMEFSVDQRYVKVFKAKLIQLDGALQAVVLAWNAQNNRSAVFLLNLQTRAMTFLKEVDSTDKTARNLHLMECMGEHVLVGSLRGEVSVFNLRESEKKVGALLHNNPAADVILSAVEMKNTGVRVNLAYVLERRTKDAPGSFAIYLLQ